MNHTMPLERILLLGGGGLLGAALKRIFNDAGVEIVAPPSRELDIRDYGALRAALEDCRPDLLINSAAQASVDRAEESPDLTYQVNAVGAQNVALICADVNLPMVQISTDYVFDGGQITPYKERCTTGVPPNTYGRSKLLGEELVRRAWRKHYILRVAALFGEGSRADFVDWVLGNADPETPLTIVNERTTSPTWTDDLARQILVIVRTPYYGTFHATGHGAATWYDLAHAALTIAGRDPRGIVPVTDAELKSAAVRARYTVLDNHLLRLRGLDTMLPWDEGLARHLKGRG